MTENIPRNNSLNIPIQNLIKHTRTFILCAGPINCLNLQYLLIINNHTMHI